VRVTTRGQPRSQPEIFLGGHRQIMEGQNFFVYSDKNEGIKCLYRYYTRKVFYEFKMRNKHEVLGSKAKIRGSRCEAPSRRRQ